MAGKPGTLAVIRTHRWDEDAARLCDQLHPVFGDDLVVVFHDRPDGLVPPIRTADIDAAWVRSQGLRALSDWGWRCGDYFLYRARDAYPGYDRYWMIEPDVLFTGPVAAFFADAATIPDDVLGVQLSGVADRHRFGRSMPPIPLYRSIFALTRFSGVALDRLLALRRGYSASRVTQRFFANDEIFCFSHAMASADLACRDLSVALPGWIDPARIATDPDILLDLLADHPSPGVFHPVRGRASFAQAVAGRIVQNMRFAVRIRASLALLADAEIEAITADASGRCRDILLRERSIGQRGPDDEGTADDVVARGGLEPPTPRL